VFNLLRELTGILGRDAQNQKNTNWTTIENALNNLQGQISQLVVHGDSSPQAAQASVGEDGTDYGGNLKARLDAENATKANMSTLPYVHVESANIFPDGSDVSTSLQSFINANKGKVIQLGLGTYHLSKPLMLPLGTILKGFVGKWNDISIASTLKRTTKDKDSKFGIDAIVIMDYDPDESYHRSGKLLNLNLEGFGDTTFRNDYGVYAKSCAFIELKDVHVRYTDQVYYTENTWQSYISMTGRYARKGIVFASPTQVSTGTSTVFEKCFMSYMDDCSYDIYGLNYSSLISCASDFAIGGAYRFNRCKGITMNSCGCEYSSDPFDNWASTITVNSMVVLHPNGKTPTTSSAYLKTRTAGKTTFNSCDFGALESPGDSYNIICDGGSTMVFNATDKPTGGNVFISYSGGSKIVEIGNAGLVVSPA
jgi:hypothetical protein